LLKLIRDSSQPRPPKTAAHLLVKAQPTSGQATSCHYFGHANHARRNTGQILRWILTLGMKLLDRGRQQRLASTLYYPSVFAQFCRDTFYYYLKAEEAYEGH